MQVPCIRLYQYQILYLARLLSPGDCIVILDINKTASLVRSAVAQLVEHKTGDQKFSSPRLIHDGVTVLCP